MNTEKLIAEINKAKYNLKLAEAFILVSEAFNNRAAFTFTSLAGNSVDLFGSERVLTDYMGSSLFTFRVWTLKHFLEMYTICTDEKHPKLAEINKIITAINLLEGEYQSDMNNLDYILNQIK